MKSLKFALGALLGCAALAACESGREAPPKATVYSVNAGPSYLSAQFRREEREEPREAPPLGYGEARRHSFDADTYDFNFDAVGQRVASVRTTLAAGNTHYVILTENANGDAEAIVLEEPTFDTGSPDAEFTIYNAAAALGDVDVYLEAPGADPAAAQPRGSIGFGERVEAATYATGDYRVTLTEPGDPAAVVFRSGELGALAGQSNLLVIIDDAGQTPAAARIIRVNATPSALVDLSAEAAMRVLNAAGDRAARDVVLDDGFAAPFAAAVPFGSTTEHTAVAPGAHDVTITPAGNPGVLEHEQSLQFQRGYYTFLITGDPSSGVAGTLALDDRRRLAGTARLRAMSAAAQFPSLDVLLVAPGTSPADASPQFQLGPAGVTDRVGFVPGSYELALRQSGTTTIVAGPVPVTLAERSVYTLVAVDGPDATSAEMLLLDDFE